MTTPRIEEIYYEKIDPEIMDFQIHVREVTGGDDVSMVDSTKLGQACRKALTKAHQAGKIQALHLLEDLYAKAKDKAELIEMFNEALQDNK